MDTSTPATKLVLTSIPTLASTLTPRMSKIGHSAGSAPNPLSMSKWPTLWPLRLRTSPKGKKSTLNPYDHVLCMYKQIRRMCWHNRPQSGQGWVPGGPFHWVRDSWWQIDLGSSRTLVVGSKIYKSIHESVEATIEAIHVVNPPTGRGGTSPGEEEEEAESVKECIPYHVVIKSSVRCHQIEEYFYFLHTFSFWY